jgi:CHAT domain-containing protein
MTIKQLFIIASLVFEASFANAQDLSMIDALLWNGEAEKALTQIEAALLHKPASGVGFELLNRKAEALIRTGKYDDAQRILKQLEAQVTPDNHLQLASLNSNYGFLYLLRGRNDLALDHLQRAITSWDQAGKSNSLEAAQTQAHLGNLYRATGKYSQANEELTVALLTRQKLLPETHELIAASYNDLGLVFSFTDPDKALEFYEKAQELYLNIHGENHPKLALAKTNIGYLYSQIELYGDAINNFESALSIWNNVYPGAHPSKGFVLFNLGRTHEKMNKLPEARAYYQQALERYNESYKGKHPDIARVYNAIGNLDLVGNQFESALENYQRALHANVADFVNNDMLINPALRNFYDGNTLLYSLLYKAQAFEMRYLRKTLHFSDLELSIKTLHTCDTLIEKLRQQINNENDKISLGAIAHEVYTDGVRISSEAAANAWSKKRYYADAFFFGEKSKAAVLLSALSDASAKSFAGIPDTLLDEEKNLKSAISLCAQKLAQKPGVEEENYLRETSYSLNRSYEAFSRRLEEDYPSYYNLKYNSTTPSVPQVQAKLTAGTLLLSYFIDEKNHRLYVFQITKKKYSLRETTLPDDFERSITGLRNSLIYSEISTFIKASTKLSSILLPRHIPASVHDLVIIPTGRLAIVPFETLLVRKPKSNASFETLNYAIKKYTVRYELSSGLIFQKQPSITKSPSILLCAPVQFPAHNKLSDLPGTESEVKEIANIFQTKNLNNAVYLKQQADETNLKKDNLKRYSYLHFATHGVVDQENPDLSRIFLHEGLGAEDGSLFAGEIYNLQLNAELVTLSACQTGLGKISRGEGVIGLSRALVYAGAKNSIVSFWKVADESTSQLMQDFYRLLLANPKNNLTTTLTEAKRNLMKDERYASPYYWAPFILIGF